jgi:hypothetical protein
MTQILMPKATAVWLIDNTGMTFKQISEFCKLHILEVEGIADGDVAAGIRGADPIANGQVSREEIEKAEKESSYAMKANTFDSDTLQPKKSSKRGPRYTPLSRRQDRPDAIAWLVRNHPEVTDAQISRLIGTTKPTIKAIRDRSHWKINLINPTDPVSLGLCSQIDLDALVKKAAEKKAKEDAKRAKELGDEGEALKPLDGPSAEPTTPEATPDVEHTLESLFKPSTDG